MCKKANCNLVRRIRFYISFLMRNCFKSRVIITMRHGASIISLVMQLHVLDKKDQPKQVQEGLMISSRIKGQFLTLEFFSDNNHFAARSSHQSRIQAMHVLALVGLPKQVQVCLMIINRKKGFSFAYSCFKSRFLPLCGTECP